MKKTQKTISFEQVIKALLDDSTPFPARYLYRLSDIKPQELVTLKRTWSKISLRRRQALMEDIQEFNEDDLLMNFMDIGFLAVQDPDPHVRLMAILTLAEYEGNDLVPVFIQAAEKDPQMEVRSAAAAALGGLIQEGEIDELPEASLKQLEECLFRILDGQDAKQVRLRALESLGYSSREEVDDRIRGAYDSGDAEWLVSALAAMGRSYNEAWNPEVLARLDDNRTTVREEAVRAAGELEIKDAAPVLKELLLDNETSIRQAAIWSLSQIGGEDVSNLFSRMLEAAEDEEEIDLLEAALENLDFTVGFPDLSLFDLDDQEEDEEAELDEE